jgi:hypothetical protein
VAKGYSQQEGLDYGDIFSPVLKLPSIRVLLAFATYYSLYIHQMDVITAYLNGELKEEIFMDLLKGFSLPPSTTLTKKISLQITKSTLWPLTI